jgi:hypothetical protein
MAREQSPIFCGRNKIKPKLFFFGSSFLLTFCVTARQGDQIGRIFPRLGEFSLIGRIFAYWANFRLFGEFSTIVRSFTSVSLKKSKFLGQFFHGKSNSKILTKNGLGYTLGDFFSQTHLVTLLHACYVLGTHLKHLLRRGGRVARFFLVQNTKTGQNVPNKHKMNQMAIKYPKCLQNIPNGHKICQHCPILGPPKFTQMMSFGLKINHLATLRTGPNLFTLTCHLNSCANMDWHNFYKTRQRAAVSVSAFATEDRGSNPFRGVRG